MFSNHKIIIKNEPITNEETEFVTDESWLQDADIKCEDTKYKIGVKSTLLDPVDVMPSSRTRTIICTESEYLVDGNYVFESIIVKEEPRLNVWDETRTTEQSISNLWMNEFSSSANDDKVIRKRAGRKTLKHKPVEKTFQCFVCKNFLKNVFVLHMHMKVHDVQEAGLYACDKCERKFKHRSYLNRHKLIHTERLFACDQCDRKCLRQSILDDHKRIHTGERPYSCDQCERKFSHSSTLYKHKKIHTGVKPFACDQCERRCLRKATLARHKKTHTGERSFTCDQCGKKFSRNSTLNHHKMMHTGENPFPCDQCERKYKTKSTLAYHKQTHIGEKAFACEHCVRRFSTKQSLRQHKQMHLGSKFACVHCDRKFSHLSSLRKHKQIHIEKPSEKPLNTQTKKKKTKFSILMTKCKNLSKI